MAENRHDRREDLTTTPEDIDESTTMSDDQPSSLEETHHDRMEDPINALDADWEEAGQPALADTTEDITLPNDRPTAMNEFGTTGTEKEAGEPMDVALSREEPDVWEREGEPEPQGTAEGAPSAGRLVAEDRGAHPDREAESTADEVGLDRGGLSPEERAVREHGEP
ncbi:hypothetical protein NI17_013100 [Thermobifida halotolerans]|uniref:DUF5709 domain-containing protein n=1 Tax=Thermobifida halotolerans TaxID=483545 RepID=A0A399G2D5_9ACTN|nr:DUF5709 domain-containing protein [Thermobifida halotolerans]UOE17822.1 hypothetical protein NI17_013100 [Thermobifida halotolerans]